MCRSNHKSEIRNQKSSAFTLVELLVVITIIGILIALLLPAVQAAREAARRLQCCNHLKQLSLGCLSHEEIHGFLPSGGWGAFWVGDPDRIGKQQPGSWAYSILPYIEQQAQHDSLTPHRLATPLAVFCCPSRRPPGIYPQTSQISYYINGEKPPLAFRGDYRANGGLMLNFQNGWVHPTSYDQGDNMTPSQWAAWAFSDNTGVVDLYSEVALRDITDGTSNTYLVGEGYINSDNYFNGLSGQDDENYEVSGTRDSICWCNSDGFYRPMPDTPGLVMGWNFGSAHAIGFHMALCDGSVHMVNYTIDPLVHSYLGNRKDGMAIDGKKF